jgi:hypothetical protein
VKDAQVEGDEISKDWREKFQGAAKAGPQRQNPRGERLTPVLQKQGLVLSPPSRQTASSDEAQNQDKRA